LGLKCIYCVIISRVSWTNLERIIVFVQLELFITKCLERAAKLILTGKLWMSHNKSFCPRKGDFRMKRCCNLKDFFTLSSTLSSANFVLKHFSLWSRSRSKFEAIFKLSDNIYFFKRGSEKKNIFSLLNWQN